MARTLFSLEIKRSRWLLRYLLVIHSLMLGMVMSLPLVYGWKISGAVFIILSCIYYYRQFQGLKSGNTIVSIERDDQGRWILYRINGVQYPRLVLNNSYVIPTLVILHFSGKLPWRYRTLVIAADAVDPELFRQLRVYCRNPKTFQR